MTKVTVLGLGAMGSRMAARLLDAGYAVTVWNRTPSAATGLQARGAPVATSPRAAAADSDVVISMVRDDGASRAVWLGPDGAFAGMREGALAIESSTLSVEWVRECADAAAAGNLRFIDAPVLGSRPQADAGQLIHLIGGTERDVADAEPVLAAIGSARHHVGPVGSGAALKLIANTLFAVQVATVAELLGRMTSLGLDPARAIGVLGETPVFSPAAKGAAALMLAGRHEPMFPVELVAKDLRYALKDAGGMPITQQVLAVMDRAAAAGHGGANLTAIALLEPAT